MKEYSPLKQYHYLYKITNLINNKIYIGIHSTNKLDDGYLGSGGALKKSIAKHGKENFKKEILEWFDWRCEALQREAQIVNRKFVSTYKTYNVDLGGNGGTASHTIETRLKISRNNWVKQNGSPMKGRKQSETFKQMQRNRMNEFYKTNKKVISNEERLHHSMMMRDKVFVNKNNELKYIHKDALNDYLKDGWVKGRKLRGENEADGNKKS